MLICPTLQYMLLNLEATEPCVPHGTHLQTAADELAAANDTHNRAMERREAAKQERDRLWRQERDRLWRHSTTCCVSFLCFLCMILALSEIAVSIAYSPSVDSLGTNYARTVDIIMGVAGVALLIENVMELLSLYLFPSNPRSGTRAKALVQGWAILELVTTIFSCASSVALFGSYFIVSSEEDLTALKPLGGFYAMFKFGAYCGIFLTLSSVAKLSCMLVGPVPAKVTELRVEATREGSQYHMHV